MLEVAREGRGGATGLVPAGAARSSLPRALRRALAHRSAAPGRCMLGVRSRRGHPPRAFPRRFVPVFGQLTHLPASRRRSLSRAAAAISLALAAPAAAPLAAQDAEPWRIVPQPQSTQVLARDGSLVAEFGRQLRTNV